MTTALAPEPTTPSTPSDSTLRVLTATTPEELRAVAKLRYTVFIEEMGWRSSGEDHARKEMADGLDDRGTILYVTNGRDIVGMVRILTAHEARGSKYEKLYPLDKLPEVDRSAITFTSNLVVAREYRGSRVLGLLLDAIYALARTKGWWLDFIHCAPHLVGLYEVMGYRRVSDVIEVPAGVRVPMALVVDDAEYLAKVRSPFSRLADKYQNDPSHGRLFVERFAEYAEPSCARVMGADDFLGYLTARVHVEDHPLLRGLTPQEHREVLNAGTVLRVPKGQAVVRAGQAGSEMFMMLSGVTEVRAPGAGGASHVLETLGTGDIFGEMSFLSNRPRSADVVALSDTEILAIDNEYLERITRSAPAAASRLLLNLSTYLVDRLQATTSSLVEALGRKSERAAA